jgi:hypothetical protein
VFECCRRAWCGPCYVAHPLDKFYVQTPQHEEGFSWLVHDEDRFRFRQARNGDHLMTPFQCDWCLFRLLTGRVPRPTSRHDEFLMCVLRRATLDAFWGRESSTVLANRRNLDQLIQVWDNLLETTPLMPPLGPYPAYDCFGITVAVPMLVKSLSPGKYASHTQFETMRKLRSAYSNLFHASALGASVMSTLGRDTAKTFLSNCPTNSLWFERFCRGCFKRMGQETHQDLAMSIAVVIELLSLLEVQWDSHKETRDTLTFVGAFVVIAYAGSFRGNEVFHVDLNGLIKYQEMKLIEGGHRYVIIPLLGRFKNEDGERYHLTPLAFESASGIKIGLWVNRLVDLKKSHLQHRGPAFSDNKGYRLSPRWLEMEILDRLHSIQSDKPDIIPKDVNVYEEYGISRSFRRGATTQARNQKVPENDINIVNRWRQVEGAQGRKPKLNMQDHYSEIRQMVPSLLRFSLAL